MTVGNHDHHTPNGEWFQVEYSEIEPRWNFPCLAHSFNVTSRVRYIANLCLLFYFLTFEKGRLPYIYPVGRSVGWSVGVTINFFNI